MQVNQMSVETTQEIMTRYFNSKHSDVSMMSEDVVFITLATGQEHHGPADVLKMLNFMYHIAFDANAEIKNTIFSEGKAVLEADFVGKHIGEFAGVPATNKQVRVPLCVVYDLEDDLIKRGRVYFEMPVLFQQLEINKS